MWTILNIICRDPDDRQEKRNNISHWAYDHGIQPDDLIIRNCTDQEDRTVFLMVSFRNDHDAVHFRLAGFEGEVQ